MGEQAKSRLIVYGHSYCGQARGLQRVLTEQNIDFEWRDVREGPAEYQDELKKYAKGNLSVPTVVFPDGSVLVEPNAQAVLERLQAKPAAEQSQGLLSRFFKR